MYPGKENVFMTSPTPPSVECEKLHVTLPVSDLAAAIEFYVTKLGFRLGFTWGEPAFLRGYRLVFGHYIYSVGPKIKIERVDVPVRMEKRLAGLLKDLAERKRMSVDSCLEEILLHTNEGVEPHTKSQLKYIEELKRKHGIDYDSHGSYRFVEE
jgi:hypothetical protein